MTSDFLLTPYTLCIDGEWGAGKSSLARIIHSHFQREDIIRKGCLSIWIDTSLIDNHDCVLAVLGETTLRCAVQLAKRILTDRRRRFEENIDTLGPMFVAFGDALGRRDQKRVLRTLKSDASRWYREWGARKVSHWDFDAFRRLVSSIRHGLLGRGGLARIAWIIDDLDRCRSSVVLRMLDVHRTLLEQLGTVLIYPMHMEIIIAVVRRHFLEEGAARAPYTDARHAYACERQAETYLEKMFFRRIRPPEPTEQQLEEWLQHHLLPEGAVFGGLAEFMRDGYFRNPRYIKRFANAVCTLSQRYSAAKQLAARPQAMSALADDDDSWYGLLALDDDSLALQILAKVTAFALADAFRAFYDPARMPSPGHLVECEVSAYAGDPLPCLVFNENDRAWALVNERASPVLVRFLKSGPRLADHFAATRSALLVTESVLPVPHIRWRTDVKIEALSAPMEKARPWGREVAPQDRERVQNIVQGWCERVGREVVVPTKIQRILQTVAPDSAVEAFVEHEWNPSPRDIVMQAEPAWTQGRERDVAWLFCAASVHEEWGAADAQACLGPARQLRDKGYAISLAQMGLARRGGDPDMCIACAQALVRSGSRPAVEQALSEALRLLGVAPETLASGKLAVADRLDEDVFLSAFLIATDALGKLDRFAEELSLAQAAAGTRSGRCSAVARNFARALERNGQVAVAVKVYHAAIALDGDQDQACAWCAACVDEGDRLDYLLAAVDRDPTDGALATAIGTRLHNSGHRTEATPWLELGVALKPEAREHRSALEKNLQVTRGLAEASKVMDPEYVPRVDDTALRAAAHAGHRNLMKKIIHEGRIEYAGVVLFDPDNLPAWIQERFPHIQERVASPKVELEA